MSVKSKAKRSILPFQPDHRPSPATPTLSPRTFQTCHAPSPTTPKMSAARLSVAQPCRVMVMPIAEPLGEEWSGRARDAGGRRRICLGGGEGMRVWVDGSAESQRCDSGVVYKDMFTREEAGRKRTHTENDARYIYTPLFTFRRPGADQRTHKYLFFVILVQLALSVPATASRGRRRVLL